MSGLRVGIENEIIALVNREIYPIVSYCKEDGKWTEGQLISPTFAMAKETGSSWSRDTRYTRSLKSDRDDWTFQLRIKFKTEVSLEPLEDLLVAGYNIKSNTYGVHAGVILEPVSSNVDHPVKSQGSAEGTDATYILRAITRN